MPTITTGLDAQITKNMQLGYYTFAVNPAGLAVPTQKRAAGAVETIDGLQFFSWGVSLAGRTLDLHWNYMDPDQFDAIDTLFEADGQIVFKPNTGTDYNVQIMDLNGEYHIDLTGSASFRKNVDLSLLIVGEVS